MVTMQQTLDRSSHSTKSYVTNVSLSMAFTLLSKTSFRVTCRTIARSLKQHEMDALDQWTVAPPIHTLTDSLSVERLSDSSPYHTRRQSQAIPGATTWSTITFRSPPCLLPRSQTRKAHLPDRGFLQSLRVIRCTNSCLLAIQQSFPNCSFHMLSDILDRNLLLLEGVSTNTNPGSVVSS